MSDQDILKMIDECISQIKGSKLTGTIQPNDSIREKLGLDSLGYYELLSMVETRMDIHIPDEDLFSFETVGDFISYLAKTK